MATRNTQIIISKPDPTWGTKDDTNIHIVLVHPEIPGNTGNIARLCAATGAVLHLVEPLGFVLQDRYLRRAGLDYWPSTTLCVHPNWEAVAAIIPQERRHLFTTKATASYADVDFLPGAALIFGRETRGLSESMLADNPGRLLKIPMRAAARSLNLSNACAIAVYEARRQVGWPGIDG